jgi:hypothetical protein
MSVLSPVELEARALAVALDAVARDDTESVERRALPASPAAVAWNPVLLRTIREQPIAVYDPLGEAEIVVDARGRVAALDDPRCAPAGREVHVSELEAVAAVAFLMGESPKEIDLEAELLRNRDGAAFLRVRNRVPREQPKSKFFQREEPKEEGPPPDRVEAEVNAATGQVFRFRREPTPLAPAKAAPVEGGAS